MHSAFKFLKYIPIPLISNFGLKSYAIRDHSNITQSLDWVGGFRKWPFLLTIITYRVGGTEKVQKPAYIIFEWSPTRNMLLESTSYF